MCCRLVWELHQDSVLLSTAAVVLFVPCGYQAVICVDLLLLQNLGGFQSQSLFLLAREAVFANEMMFLFRDIRWSVLSSSHAVLLGCCCWGKESIRCGWVHNVLGLFFSSAYIAIQPWKEAQIFLILGVHEKRMWSSDTSLPLWGLSQHVSTS